MIACVKEKTTFWDNDRCKIQMSAFRHLQCTQTVRDTKQRCLFTQMQYVIPLGDTGQGVISLMAEVGYFLRQNAFAQLADKEGWCRLHETLLHACF